MDNHFYSITTGNVLVFAEFPGTDIKSDYEVDKIVFEIAGPEILNKGGGVGISKVRDLMPRKPEHPAGSLTHPDHPGVFVWFPSTPK